MRAQVQSVSSLETLKTFTLWWFGTRIQWIWVIFAIGTIPFLISAHSCWALSEQASPHFSCLACCDPLICFQQGLGITSESLGTTEESTRFPQLSFGCSSRGRSELVSSFPTHEDSCLASSSAGRSRAGNHSGGSMTAPFPDVSVA